jgi:RNA polymerase sigma-70 factor, ECF subfamily
VWPRDGVPRNPGAWLTTAARNRALDRVRRAATEQVKLRRVAAEPEPAPPTEVSAVPDDRLELIFACCHPALPVDGQVALTLRYLAGLTTAEIARAFLVPEKTMAQRLTRAKNKIRHAGIPFRVPPPDLLPERCDAVFAVLYLLFNEGYAASAGPEQLRRPLTAEAIALTRVLVALLPREPEGYGLLALMLLHESRHDTRLDTHGDLVPLEEQDRTRWDRAAIEEGVAVLDRGLDLRRPGPYQLMAAIAACHATAPHPDLTDWAQIALLYGELLRHAPGPVVELNRAVAVAMADGPQAGLALLEGLDLPGYHLLPATRADLLRRLGRDGEAAAAYREALALVRTDAERRFLARRLSAVSAG